MSQYGDMYRELAQKKRREAEEYDRLAIDADERDLQQREDERLLASVSRDTILKAAALYETSPRQIGRSDDAYSTWTEQASWSDLYDSEKAEYVRKVISTGT